MKTEQAQQNLMAPPPPLGFEADPASVDQPHNKRSGKRIALIACLVPVGLFFAFVVLGLILNAFGYESTSDGLVVPGAEVVDEYVAANGGTTWTVVTEANNPSDAELTAIATALISLPEAEPLLENDLDILLFDDGGRRWRNFIENVQELDKAGADADLERIFELAQDYPTEWVNDHSLGSVNARLGADGNPTYTLCIRAIGTASCTPDDRIILQPVS